MSLLAMCRGDRVVSNGVGLGSKVRIFAEKSKKRVFGDVWLFLAILADFDHFGPFLAILGPKMF